jgi:type IV pilus assembly protein PilW
MKKSHPLRRRQRGVSLIELMVAMLLGLLLMGAVLQFYLANKASFVNQEQNAYLQESGRYALGDIARTTRMAGLSGCSSRPIPGKPLTVINHLNGGDYAYALFASGVRGFEANGTGPADAEYEITDSSPAPSATASDWTPALPATGRNELVGDVVAGNDVLVVTLSSPPVPLVDPFTDATSFKASSPNDLQRYDIAVVSNCQQAEIFQITNLTTTSGRANVVGSAGGAVPGNAGPISNTGPTRDFRAGSEISALRTYVYYVGVGAGGQPALFRSRLAIQDTNENRLLAEELVSGVESMQLTYGIDGDEDFVVNSYVPADEVTDWLQVRAVRVALLLRSPDEFLPSEDGTLYTVAGSDIDPVDDRRQRRVFETTIALRNRLL